MSTEQHPVEQHCVALGPRVPLKVGGLADSWRHPWYSYAEMPSRMHWRVGHTAISGFIQVGHV